MDPEQSILNWTMWLQEYICLKSIAEETMGISCYKNTLINFEY